MRMLQAVSYARLTQGPRRRVILSIHDVLAHSDPERVRVLLERGAERHDARVVPIGELSPETAHGQV